MICRPEVLRMSSQPTIETSGQASRDEIRPKHLPIVGTAPALVPARMINEVLYCERLLYLEWAQGEFADNAFTVEGRAVHKRADQPGGRLPSPPTAPAAPNTSDNKVGTDNAEGAETRPYQARTLWLSSERLGITAKIDIIEGDADGRVVPIEYKRGKAPDLPEGAYLPERAQLCAQALLLRDHGYVCETASIYFAGSRRRVPIALDDALIAATLRAVARAREVADATQIPSPLVDSPKCNGCSLVGICLPDEVNMLRGFDGDAASDEAPETPVVDDVTALLKEVDTDPWELVPDNPTFQGVQDIPVPGALRRLHPANDEKVPLYVQDQGARIGLDGECLVVRGRQGPSSTARLPDTSQVVLLGNVQISAQAMRALLERNIQVSFLSYGGWYYGRATGVDSNNVELRVAQHRAAGNADFAVRLARGLVASKIRNSRTLVRRNHGAPPLLALSELEQLARKAEKAEALDTLLGLEGTAARTYFGAFTGMLKGNAALSGAFDLDGRNRRPPKDPINALLSFSYSLLTKDFVLALAAVGLDPLLGYYHQPRFGRPALALDLMEEFRPLIADSTVIGALNGGTFGEDDFITHPTGVSMTAPARRRLIAAYERRMEQLITHPVFGYRISYRRVLEVQARLLARTLLGELDEYPSFRTR
jgi:CRISPR-associated protein Cas1